MLCEIRHTIHYPLSAILGPKLIFRSIFLTDRLLIRHFPFTFTNGAPARYGLYDSGIENSRAGSLRELSALFVWNGTLKTFTIFMIFVKPSWYRAYEANIFSNLKITGC